MSDFNYITKMNKVFKSHRNLNLEASSLFLISILFFLSEIKLSNILSVSLFFLFLFKLSKILFSKIEIGLDRIVIKSIFSTEEIKLSKITSIEAKLENVGGSRAISDFKIVLNTSKNNYFIEDYMTKELFDFFRAKIPQNNLCDLFSKWNFYRNVKFIFLILTNMLLFIAFLYFGYTSIS